MIDVVLNKANALKSSIRDYQFFIERIDKFLLENKNVKLILTTLDEEKINIDKGINVVTYGGIHEAINITKDLDLTNILKDLKNNATNKLMNFQKEYDEL